MVAKRRGFRPPQPGKTTLNIIKYAKFSLYSVYFPYICVLNITQLDYVREDQRNNKEKRTEIIAHNTNSHLCKPCNYFYAQGKEHSFRL